MRSTLASGQTFHLASLDVHALNATQIVLSGRYGPGSHPGTIDCPTQKSTTSGYCYAVTNFTVPSGKRLVIENISVSFSISPNGSPYVFNPVMSIGLTVSGTTAFSVLPFESTTVAGNTTSYVMQKSLRLYADAGIGFPELIFGNLNRTVGPDLGVATGFSITISGYYISTK